ncbi:glycoside hydrolase [Tengunoibacter tsumagoiensis]|uniref:Glycoside hydrolase family 2 immunoglobulin-like beta-sandwich domain-containing protein n=1 Tax=Tengunoibacter tsumagoiensis TaxID=2014871 RepID=A0A402A0S8_9CHLR|nr:glycoside hydrolase [Tengunoibacter tsumagoiensis]GCE12685.1 hypothetical protein KTT_25440 [Tengunoibacter tsumagoiensis]
MMSGQWNLSLDGDWEIGLNRQYEQQVVVPGLAADPCQITQGTLWYRRTLTLPDGDWTHATLRLTGARFCPAVYVNGHLVSSCSGGMTVTNHPLQSAAISPGATIQLEIALQSLQNVDPDDASLIPRADRWRTNLSSGLWDHVSLHLHSSSHITRIIPSYDLSADQLKISWWLSQSEPMPTILTFTILDTTDRQLITIQEKLLPIEAETGQTMLNLQHACSLWSPEHPVCYRLQATLRSAERILDVAEMTLGLKTFRTDGLRFLLNEQPVHLRAGTVVWQRWLRDPEAHQLAFDTAWFEQNIILRLKQHGANTLRFHLGVPPEALLDLCDQHGLLVQTEWHFFHGMEASLESLCTQWRQWLDLCFRHPSICLIHPWNETEGVQLQTALQALERLTPDYPPLVISHRDVLHLHKYWWSLFENVGLYYDAADQFPLPIMVDEFGGNYLDGQGEPGGYPALTESFLRFLGHNHTASLRLQLQTEANSQIAEYWRRLGAAGFSPFCILGSPEDGCHHFLGPLQAAKPKPVWEALTAAYAPLSCSLEVWDRNYLPGQQVSLPVTFFNETPHPQYLEANIQITCEDVADQPSSSSLLTCQLAPYAQDQCTITLQVPDTEGCWRFCAELQSPVQPAITHPVVSSWRFRTLRPQVPASLQTITIGLSPAEPELQTFCLEQQLKTCALTDPTASLLLGSSSTWEALSHGALDPAIFEQALLLKKSILLLDVGPQKLGYGYTPGSKGDFLQGSPRVNRPEKWEYELFCGLRLCFQEVAEPESCLHPTHETAHLWSHLDQQATWLWNGLRGGLIVPAVTMEVQNLNADSFLSLWQTRGADGSAMQLEAHYVAYELAGFYAFAHGDDPQVHQHLRERVQFLVADAPALAASLDPYAPIQSYPLSQRYRELQQQSEQTMVLTPLAVCGKQLARTPLWQIDSGAHAGRLLLSQLMTQGRIAHGSGSPGLYGLRYDPAAVQFTLNLIHHCLQSSRETL